MLFYNEDWMHFLWTRYNAGIEVTEENLREYIYSFKGTQVTDFTMNVNGTISTAPSKVFETFADKYLAKEENGIPVDFTDTLAKWAYSLQERNIDMYAVWTKTLKEIGINPWISVRFNDCHGNTEKTEFRKSSYVEAHPELHLAARRKGDGYFDRCFDYGKEEVRSRMLAYIEEMLSRYDVYGLELDMMRDLFIFSYGFEKKNRPIMKKFFEDIYALLQKYGEKYGHKIKLAITMAATPDVCLEKGLNILDIADKLDCITLIGRWATTDTNMPFELWKMLLRGYDVKIGGGQQLLCRPYARAGIPPITTVKAAFGQAIANLDCGSDYVYLYNYMDMATFEGELSEWTYPESIRNDENRPLIFNNIGKKETLLKQSRSHVVTYNDFPAYLNMMKTLLPLKFSQHSGYQPIKINVGEIPENAKVRLILGINGEEIAPADISVYANSAKCEFDGMVKLHKNIYDKPCYSFEIIENRFETVIAEVRIQKECMLEYVEIEVLV